MNGPNEFFCIGTLRNWSVVDDVHKITAPTLLASGIRRGDAATVQPFFDNIPDVRWEIFETRATCPSSKNPNATSTSSKVSWRTMTSEVVVKK